MTIFWTTKSGVKLTPDKMTTDHIINCAKLLINRQTLNINCCLWQFYQEIKWRADFNQHKDQYLNWCYEYIPNFDLLEKEKLRELTLKNINEIKFYPDL